MDHEFDDDDSFGALPDDTLQELEYAAISSTQKPKTVATGVQQPHIRTYGATGLSRNNYASKGQWRPPIPRQQQQFKPPAQVQTAPPASAPAPPSSDYGFDEEDVIDLDEPSMVITSTTSTNLPSRSRSEAPTRAPAARTNGKKALDPETEAAFAAADAELADVQPGQNQWPAGANLGQHVNASTAFPAEVAALQARIDALLNENTRLQQSEASARNATQQKSGEIAIVRANHAKAEKEYERRIAVMQKMHADESAKSKAELEQGKKEREKLETDRRFLAHDFEEAKRERLSSGVGGTPKKKNGAKSTRGALFGDGFDADEAMIVSPSRSKDREKERERNSGSREHTPRVGNKRKRGAVQDSPVPLPALSFSAPHGQVAREDSEKTLASDAEATNVGNRAGREEDDVKYDFMQKLFLHIPYEGHGRSMETLTKHSFPSNTSRSLSSLLLDGLSSPSTNALSTIEPLPRKVTRILLNIWSQCLRETYYTPLYLILDLIHFALSLERASAIITLIPHAVPLCIKTIELVANSTVRAALYPSFAGSDEYKKVREQVGQHIDVDEVLDFLRRLCDAAACDRSNEGSGSSEVFWQCVDVNFVLLMLNKAQHISQITSALRILSTSALDSTFGPICYPISTMIDASAVPESAEKQNKQENILIERLVSLLLELPVAPDDEAAYSEEEIQELRLEILAVLRTLAFTEHGRGLLGRHRTAIGRLVRFLDLQMAKLYSVRPSLGMSDRDLSDTSTARPRDLGSEDSSEEEKWSHDLIAETINVTVRLLYHLLLGPSSHSPGMSSSQAGININLQEKLQATRGGWHKFLVSFTRIAFSDQLVLEAGIEDAVVEAAHRVLDEVLSPEEGEAVCAAVETPRGTSRGVAESVDRSVEAEVEEREPG